jgi:hypothetical protein
MGEFRDITLTNYTCSGSYNLDTGTNIVVNGKNSADLGTSTIH